MSRSAARSGCLACVLLAAGGSRRLGTPKQLARSRAQPLLRRAVESARRALPASPLVVVLGAHATRFRLLVQRTEGRATVVYNAGWAEGIASSLRAGIAALPHGVTAALVLLADQPAVDARAVARLAAAWRNRPGQPAAAAYLDRIGVPAILPRRYWRALRELRGDSGARALLRGARNVTRVAMPEAELDVDTPEDLQRLR
jgi:CTP:molybdopterin cytidylyltransferase MocA